MATNKHATIRYQTLDKCFRNPGRKYFIEDLLTACNKAIYDYSGVNKGIQRRQILEDIKFMESTQGWNIPLERIREGHKKYFRYSDTRFSINNQPLNLTEENQLREALLMLSRFKGMPQFEWVDEITARLDSGLGLSDNSRKIIEFEQNNYLKGLEFITPIYNAILNKHPLIIKYQGFKQETSKDINFHPYFLKQYNTRWFVFGADDAILTILNLALDRIISAKESNKKYNPSLIDDLDEYFEDIIGVTYNKKNKLENILLRVERDLLPYIKTKPLHGSQRITREYDSHAIISLELIPNYELEALILSLGEGIEVIEPVELRNLIKKRIEKSLNKYL